MTLRMRRFQRSRPFLRQRRLADILIVGLALAGAVLAELEMQQQAAVAEQRAADPRAERQHAFEPRPWTTPSPCTAASLSMRTGTPKRSASAPISSKPAQ